MTETAAEPVYIRRMPDFEKSLGVQPPAVDDMPNKVEPREPSPYDANSSEVAKDTAAEKESAGSMRDYFVSGEREHLCCIGLMLG